MTDAPRDDLFYTPPVPLPDGRPGDVIYSRPLDNPVAELSEGENWLVLYLSENVRGEPIAVSGIVVLPRGEAPTGGFPVIAWAHGTVGVADGCAPSRDTEGSLAHPMNAYPQAMLNRFLREKWAVVMTDYEGLGTTDRVHPYLLGQSEAYGVLDSVRAARVMFGERVSQTFAIVGHSQGGQAALFAAHYASGWAPELQLAGVAAIAPANHPLGLVRVGAKLPVVDEGLAFTPLFLCGAMGGDPSIEPGEVLAQGVFNNRWGHVFERCRAGLSERNSWGGVLGTLQFKGDYPDSPNDHQRAFEEQLAAMNPDVEIDVPIRITQAADDDRVKADPPGDLKGTTDLVDELGDTNPKTPLEYELIPAGRVPKEKPLGVHFATINYDTPALVGWLKDRLRS
ncbi:alpha/beta fold hydrolase [Actinomadura barringtoniae]|uniref:Alpha/beta fold hydrolase n=1 Tax=Actinomadura barringtoniae TaxID=1427535 RepID=A0A939PFH5_9ACTN|nr:lipase family protein [Actinomadura barringtoniae]MBO2451725.1 alpha/beta fold hydrolase [Actinomadura barringtoniae]